MKDYMITISIQDIFMSLFWISLVVLIVYIIFVLARVLSIVLEFRNIVKENRSNIDLIIEELPGISKGVNGVVNKVDQAGNSFMPSVENLAEASNEFTSNIRDNNPLNAVLLNIYKAVEALNKVLDSFSKNK